jgi:flavodoxin
MQIMNVPFKKIVIYYSFDGNTKLIAKSMAGAIGADLMPIVPKKELTSKGFSKYFWGSSQVMMKRKPALMPPTFDPMDYDLVIIGTPVWAWTSAPPVTAFLSAIDLKDKQIALFCCHGGNAGKTFVHMKRLVPDNHFIGEIEFLEPLHNNRDQAVNRAEKWVEALLAKIAEI